jgi:hypothetical protein
MEPMSGFEPLTYRLQNLIGTKSDTSISLETKEKYNSRPFGKRNATPHSNKRTCDEPCRLGAPSSPSVAIVVQPLLETSAQQR